MWRVGGVDGYPELSGWILLDKLFPSWVSDDDVFGLRRDELKS
jgi:hypothetical protein